MQRFSKLIFVCLSLVGADFASAQIAVKGDKIYTMQGAAIEPGIVLLREGKIEQIGAASSVRIPQDYRILNAKIVTPGIIDAHTVAGLTGYMNQAQDQDQLDPTDPMQPELRAFDAYNAEEHLLEWLRGFGITTMQTGPAPQALISGQMCIVKTKGRTIEQALFKPYSMLTATLGEHGKAEKDKSPGTRGKMMAMLRSEFLKAQEYQKKLDTAEEDKKPERDLRREALLPVLRGEVPLLVTVHKAQDILNALRLAEEFQLKIVLDGAAEAYLVLEEIKQSGFPVILHPTMYRAGGETKNLAMDTAVKLKEAGILFALQSGYEGYVPKTRVVLLEAAVAAGHGLAFDDALAAITVNAAKILGIDERVGSIAVGKDADLALFDGDPFEYTSHCMGTIIDGELVSNEPR